jgi:hypothetical protein
VRSQDSRQVSEVGSGEGWQVRMGPGNRAFSTSQKSEAGCYAGVQQSKGTREHCNTWILGWVL